MMEKIQREFFVLKEQTQKIKKVLTKLQPISINVQPYLKAFNYLKGMNRTFSDNFFELLDQQKTLALLQNYRFITDDLLIKIKLLHDSISKSQDEKNSVDVNKQFCFICNQNIHENNIKHTKNSLENNPKKEFNQALDQFKKMTEEKIFTDEENMDFQRKLYHNLSQKQKILNMYSREIEQFTSLVDSSITQLNALKEIKSKDIDKNSEGTRYVNMGRINQDVTKFLKTSFKDKIPPWIHKMFQRMIRLYIESVRQKNKEIGTQTINYEPVEINQCSKQNRKLKRTVQSLKEEIKQHLDYQERLKTLVKQNSIADLIALKNVQNNRPSNSILFPSTSKFSTLSQKQEIDETLSQSDPQEDKSLSKKSEESEEKSQSLTNFENIPIRKKQKRVSIKKSIPKTKPSKGSAPTRTNESSFKVNLEVVKKPKAVAKKKKIEKQENGERWEKDENKNELENIIYQEQIKEMEAQDQIDQENESIEESSENIKSEKTVQKESKPLERSSKLKKDLLQRQLLETTHEGRQMIKTQSNFSKSSSQFPQKKVDKFKQTKPKKMIEKTPEERMSFNERLTKQKSIVKQVSQLLKQKRSSKQSILPKIPQQNLKSTMKSQQNDTSLMERKKAQRQPRIEKTTTSIYSKMKSFKESQRQAKQLSFSKSMDDRETLNEEHAYSVLKQHSYLPATMNFMEFRTLLREQKIKQMTNSQKYHMATFSSSERTYNIGKQQFKDEDYNLFISLKIAHRYQGGLSKNYHKRYLPILNSQELETCSKVFQQLLLMKKQEHKKYNKICCVLRYPYQTLFNNFSILNFVSDMNYGTFEVYFRKLCWIHRNCGRKKGVCHHIQQFFRVNME